MPDWFTEHAPESDWFSSNAPVPVKSESTAPSRPSDSTALALAGARGAASLAAHGAMVLATSPTVAQTTSAVARGATTLGALGHGLYSGNMQQVLAAPVEGWAAGKGGYWLAKGAQSVAAPVANAMETVAPYLQAANKLIGPQGALDLAQMAEPNRKDIGFMGIGKGVQSDPNHPAIINGAVNFLISKGYSKLHALEAVIASLK